MLFLPQFSHPCFFLLCYRETGVPSGNNTLQTMFVGTSKQNDYNAQYYKFQVYNGHAHFLYRIVI
jgi:hypothetical protein